MENLYRKRDASLVLRKFNTFIKTRTKQRVKYLKINQDNEFSLQKLETWQAENI